MRWLLQLAHALRDNQPPEQPYILVHPDDRDDMAVVQTDPYLDETVAQRYLRLEDRCDDCGMVNGEHDLDVEH